MSIFQASLQTWQTSVDEKKYVEEPLPLAFTAKAEHGYLFKLVLVTYKSHFPVELVLQKHDRYLF